MLLTFLLLPARASHKHISISLPSPSACRLSQAGPTAAKAMYRALLARASDWASACYLSDDQSQQQLRTSLATNYQTNHGPCLPNGLCWRRPDSISTCRSAMLTPACCLLQHSPQQQQHMCSRPRRTEDPGRVPTSGWAGGLWPQPLCRFRCRQGKQRRLWSASAECAGSHSALPACMHGHKPRTRSLGTVSAATVQSGDALQHEHTE